MSLAKKVLEKLEKVEGKLEKKYFSELPKCLVEADFEVFARYKNKGDDDWGYIVNSGNGWYGVYVTSQVNRPDEPNMQYSGREHYEDDDYNFGPFDKFKLPTRALNRVKKYDEIEFYKN